MRKQVTMRDIAEQLGISVNAVSLALNDRVGVGERTRKKVLDTAENMGYLDQSTKYVQTYSQKNICILLENRFFKDMQFYGRILLGLEEAAKKAGFDLLINSFEGDENIPPCVENKKVSGMIVVGKITDRFLISLKNYRIPIVLLDHTSLLESTDSVLTDNKLGSFKMTKYLIDRGFKKIGFFGGIDYSMSITDRFWGYHEAVTLYFGYQDLYAATEYTKKYSVVSDIENYVISQDIKMIGERFSMIREVPQAVLCSNDKAAILLCKVLNLRGYRIPEEISIVGFDDIELSKMVYPSITTVHVDKERMGRKAIECLLKRLEHPKEKVEKIIMDVQIVERDSVGTPYERE